MQCSGDHKGKKIHFRWRKKTHIVRPVATRLRRKQENQDQASTWLNSKALNLKKVRGGQLAIPVLSMVNDWVDIKERLDISKLSPERRELKYLLGQYISLEISSGVLTRRLENVGMVPKIQILITGGLRDIVLRECHESVTAGYLGRIKTLSNVKRRCYVILPPAKKFTSQQYAQELQKQLHYA